MAVVTTPDRPKGRGLHVEPNPVKDRADRTGVLAVAPAKLRDPELERRIDALRPDVLVVASYGKLIPGSWLKIPRKSGLNIHPSLLPKYRGAAPIPWQILEGERETGVTIAEVTEALDAGDILYQLRVKLEAGDTTGSLTSRLSLLSTEALAKVLSEIENGRVNRLPQKEEESSYARKLSKEDGQINLSEPAEVLERKVRAFDPWPGTFISFQGKPLRIVQAGFDPREESRVKPGTLLEVGNEDLLRVKTGKGSLKIMRVQLPGRQIISGKDFANGQRLKTGFVFESFQ